MKVGIVDYGRGNIRSVENAFLAIGADTVLITRPEQLQNITHLVLPGQGEFGDCAANLKKQGMFEAIREWTAEDKPYLGICVGYQLIFEKSVESPSAEGLALLPGTVKRFPDVGLKIPHMGWNEITHADHQLLNSVDPNSGFYFLHSYYFDAKYEDSVIARAFYNHEFDCAVNVDNVFAVQFHPEKSHENGIQLFKNFWDMK